MSFARSEHLSAAHLLTQPQELEKNDNLDDVDFKHHLYSITYVIATLQNTLCHVIGSIGPRFNLVSQPGLNPVCAVPCENGES